MSNNAAPGADSHAQRSSQQSSYIPNSSSINGGGTYTSVGMEPTLSDYENVFGPSARDIKDDLQRYKRHGRWHLPDVLKGPNPWLADRIDGLITDAASSPFTSTILPYKYFDNVDGKLKWNVWSFDEAMPSRVPYEAAARTLTQTKSSFSAYAVRSGLAITMEHNFMMTPTGRENFQNQLNQLVGSIQYANDYDVHIALILAPSYEKRIADKFNNFNKSSAQVCREYVDLFGFMQKNQNGLDILIEEAKLKLKLWGGPMPNFMLTNSKLTFQLQMNPERTNYISQGIDGVKRLRQGPDLTSYRGVSVVPSRSFSLENGQPPRDMLRRRVRVAEYYRIVGDSMSEDKTFEFYNEDRDTFFNVAWKDLFKYAQVGHGGGVSNEENTLHDHIQANINRYWGVGMAGQLGKQTKPENDEAHAKLGKHTNDWKQLFQLLEQQQNNTEGSVVIPSNKLIASFLNKNTVFVPFVQSLHFDKEYDNTHTSSNGLNKIPNHFTAGINQSKAPYPRLTGDCEFPHQLLHPCSQETFAKGTVDYNESRMLLARMFRRYAAPTQFIKAVNNQLMFNNECLSGSHLDLQEMFYQPLGAFNEPNHPLFAENMLLGRARDVHSSWILTENVLDLLLEKPDRWAMAAQVAASVNGRNMNKAEYSVKINEKIEDMCNKNKWEKTNRISEKNAVYTWGLHDNYLLSGDYLNLSSDFGQTHHAVLRQHAHTGVVTNKYLEKLVEMGGERHPWLQPVTADGKATGKTVLDGLSTRLTTDAYHPYVGHLSDSVGCERMLDQLCTDMRDYMPSNMSSAHYSESLGVESGVGVQPSLGVESGVGVQPSLGVNYVFRPSGNIPEVEHTVQTNPSNWEFVIVRPNIEHYMLGVILGLSGGETGYTLWGQTEMSVYDDSQHGVWGMSYKYHSRAIVFTEKNIIRLWDVAYDGYNGGKNDTYVDWSKESDVNSFKEDTNNLTADYRGKSMMVMAFYRDHARRQNEDYVKNYKTNWPSPVLFYDNGVAAGNNIQGGAENQNNIGINEFRVFDRNVYPQYDIYKDKMPNFFELHQMRKPASEATHDDETQVECLAFQGTMKIKMGGSCLDTINGSGHHGVDYVGVSSVRAGKGYKMTGGISQIVRQI